MYTGMPIQCPCLDYCREKSNSLEKRDGIWNHGYQHQQILRSQQTDPFCPPIKYTPGYLQTYTTVQPLKSLYIDGIAGGKSSRGTLDTQDLITLNYSSPPPNFSDFTRAKALCDLSQTEWDSRIDGFIRVMFGFELILCEFEDAVELTDSVRAERSGLGTPYVEKEIGEMKVLVVYKGIEDQFFGLSGGRLKVDFEGMVSVFAVEGVDLWGVGKEDQPRLASMSQEQKDKIRERLKVVISGKDGKGETPELDWQAIVDVIISHYAKRLYDYAYVANSYFLTPGMISTNLNLLARPFID
jgi:hypothetical protein